MLPMRSVTSRSLIESPRHEMKALPAKEGKMRQLFRQSRRRWYLGFPMILLAAVVAVPSVSAQEIVESHVYDGEYEMDYGTYDNGYAFDTGEGFGDGGSCDECGCGECDECEKRGCCVLNMCRDWRNRRREANWFSCSCNGSYKFPVPPLYTYHWPGLYQLERMTDYHSPWRFPPIKPYAPEPQFEDQASYSMVMQTSGVRGHWPPEVPRHGIEPKRRGGAERMSTKLKRAYGITR